MNETHQQIVNVAKEAIEKILTLTETTQTQQPETQDLEKYREQVIDKAVDGILEDSSQIKDDIVDRVADTIDNSDISDSVYDRLDIDDIVSGVAERVDDDEIAQKIADNLVEQDCLDFYKKLVTALMVKIAEAEEAKKATATA
jgi:hypothetical protein